MYFKNADARKVDTYRLSMHAIVALHGIPAQFDADAVCFKIFVHAYERVRVDSRLNLLDREDKPVTGTKMYSLDGQRLLSGYASLNGLAALSKDERIAAINFTQPLLRRSPDRKGPEIS